MEINEVQIKRKRVTYQDNPSEAIVDPTPTDVSIPEDLLNSNKQQWRKLRLLEARLVGRVLSFEVCIYTLMNGL